MLSNPTKVWTGGKGEDQASIQGMDGTGKAKIMCKCKAGRGQESERNYTRKQWG